MIDVSSSIMQIQQQFIEMLLKNDSGWFKLCLPIFGVIIGFILGKGWDYIDKKIYKKKVLSSVITELEDEKKDLNNELLKFLKCIENFYIFIVNEGSIIPETRNAIERFLLSSDSRKEEFYMYSSVENRNSFKKIIKCYNSIHKNSEKLNKSREAFSKEMKIFKAKFCISHKRNKEFDEALKYFIIEMNNYVKLCLIVISHIDSIVYDKKIELNNIEEIKCRNKYLFGHYFKIDYKEWHKKYNKLLRALD